MRLAQDLYEGIELSASEDGAVGLITYMRTDHRRAWPRASAAARE
jgi:DNA topoisomerase IA